MSLEYSIDRTKGVVTLHYAEDPSLDLWTSTMDAVLRDPEFRPGYALLLDRSRLATAPEADYIRGVVEYMRGHAAELGGARVAIVVGNAAAYGMARMAQILLEDPPEASQVFTKLEEAMDWLGRGRRPS